MNTIRIATCLLAGALLMPVVAAADRDADRDHPGQFVKDSVITTAIKTKLAAEHFGSLTEIKVDTDMDGIVWLSGTANTHGAVDRAVEIARGTDGVVGVRNDIVVVPEHH
jgi:hyperosmotically inducible protein